MPENSGVGGEKRCNMPNAAKACLVGIVGFEPTPCGLSLAMLCIPERIVTIHNHRSAVELNAHKAETIAVRTIRCVDLCRLELRVR